jgi:hypothetical protein
MPPRKSKPPKKRKNPPDPNQFTKIMNEFTSELN